MSIFSESKQNNDNTTFVECPSIHLKRKQFKWQDYNEIMQIYDNKHNVEVEVDDNSQNHIQHINQLINQLESMDNPKRIHIVHISDTHKSYKEYAIPFKPNMINILIHSGDLSYNCSLPTNKRIPLQFVKFTAWLRKLPHHKKIVIAGNHDVIFRQLGKQHIHAQIFKNDPSIIYLQDDMVNLYGINIYGTPWCLKGAFKINRKKETLQPKWKLIPNNIDILVSHQHPFEKFIKKEREGGCQYLWNEVINRVKPKVHLFGHHHDGNGYKLKQDILFINSAMDDIHTSHVFDMVFDTTK